ncbi:MAG: ribonuclease domain-containing protein [Ilumatobacteraceae bacterium]
MALTLVLVGAWSVVYRDGAVTTSDAAAGDPAAPSDAPVPDTDPAAPRRTRPPASAPRTSTTTTTATPAAPADVPAGFETVTPAGTPARGAGHVGAIDRVARSRTGADDGTFRTERLLPIEDLGYYREYTVETPGSPDRGARRIVAGENGERFYTDDHYDSFRWC